jgi:hypothetical protein
MNRAREACFNSLSIDWQANVETTGNNQDFYSDIMLGAEGDLSANYDELFSTSLEGWIEGKEITIPTDNLEPQNLKVLYLDGELDVCVPRDGSFLFTLKFKLTNPNLSSENAKLIGIDKIIAGLKISQSVFIDCAPAGFDVPAEAQNPFHGEALIRFNKGRLNEAEMWEFELDYDPGGGVVAQFEEGPKTFNWEHGQQDLWQLITVYQATPAE